MSHDLDTLPNLLGRLESYERTFLGPGGRAHGPERALVREAIDTLKAQAETTRELNRRASAVEQPLAIKIGSLEQHLAWATKSRSSSFSRLIAAQEEIRRIYDQIRRARSDGCDRYHSVTDLRGGGEAAEPGTVWANLSNSQTGEKVSVRPAAVIKEVIDELLALRASKSEGEA